MIEAPNKGGVYDENRVAKRVAELMERVMKDRLEEALKGME